MKNYKINFIYSNDSNDTINDLLIKVLKREIDIKFNMIYTNNKSELSSQCSHLSLQDKGVKSEI